jgi:methionyl-tRNA formyltransferase
MKVLCVSYRPWAIEIYSNIKKEFTNIHFLIIDSKKDYNEDFINKMSPDLILFYGWSWMVSRRILESYTCLMLHPSKLPLFRGGSPIQNQIIRGVTESAVTIFRMNEEVDAGDILFQEPLDLSKDLKGIFSDMTEIGTEITKKIINMFPYLVYFPQEHHNATYYKRRKPSESEITINDLSTKDSAYIVNKIRMLDDPYPAAFIRLADGKKLLIKKVLLESSEEKQ